MASRLRIALIAPLAESVPPRGYGGTERVVSYLAEQLVRQGHQVTLFASADSHTAADLVACAPAALRGDPGRCDPVIWHLLMLEKVDARLADFDIVHSHLHYLAYPLMRRMAKPAIATMHGRMDLADYRPLYDEYADQPLVAISAAQRRALGRANWVQTIHHGLPVELYQARYEPGDYLAFVGRMSAEKRVDAAIDVAISTGTPLKIAAKVDDVDRGYFEAEIAPKLNHGLVEFVGEIGEDAKAEFLGNAAALMFLVDWPEPFGLAMIEAMACATPVIARCCGAIGEVVDHGVSGFVCDDVDDAVEAVGRLDSLDRHAVRHSFERRFSAQRMTRDYVRAYRQAIASYDKGRWRGSTRRRPRPR